MSSFCQGMTAHVIAPVDAHTTAHCPPLLLYCYCPPLLLCCCCLPLLLYCYCPPLLLYWLGGCGAGGWVACFVAGG